MGLLSLIYLICALRTNLVFVAIFLGLLLTFVILTGAYWHTALGHTEMAERLQVAAGAFGFLATLAGWWIFFAQMLASVDFPFQIPGLKRYMVAFSLHVGLRAFLARRGYVQREGHEMRNDRVWI